MMEDTHDPPDRMLSGHRRKEAAGVKAMGFHLELEY
jgi:hypothetical protein